MHHHLQPQCTHLLLSKPNLQPSAPWVRCTVWFPFPSCSHPPSIASSCLDAPPELLHYQPLHILLYRQQFNIFTYHQPTTRSPNIVPTKYNQLTLQSPHTLYPLHCTMHPTTSSSILNSPTISLSIPTQLTLSSTLHLPTISNSTQPNSLQHNAPSSNGPPIIHQSANLSPILFLPSLPPLLYLLFPPSSIPTPIPQSPSITNLQYSSLPFLILFSTHILSSSPFPIHYLTAIILSSF